MCRFLDVLPLVPARQLVEINAKLLAVGATLDLATDIRPRSNVALSLFVLYNYACILILQKQYIGNTKCYVKFPRNFQSNQIFATSCNTLVVNLRMKSKKRALERFHRVNSRETPGIDVVRECQRLAKQSVDINTGLATGQL